MKKKYGIDWPDNYHDVFIDMVLAKHWQEEPYCHANLDHPADHLLRACRRLLSSKDFTISSWSEEHAKDWTETDFCITWGGAACSKSNDFGLFSVMDWATDPLDTIVLMASTTREMLKIRSYESVVRYFKLLKSNPFFLFPGKESKTTVAILNVDDDDAPSTTKSSIRGSAVNEGGSLQGAHLPYVRLILDELSEMKPHGMNARSNLSKGCRNFKCFGICNPTSFYDEGSKYSVPIDGWAAVTPDDTMWETRWGRVRHHDGLKSPAITEPGGVKKYPHLINQAQIDRQIKEEDGNVEARDVWIFVRGFPPRSGVDDTVLTPELIQVHKMQQPPVWLTPKEKLIYVAGLDAAFTSGGDDCIVKIGAIGTTTDYINTLAFVDTIKLPIVAGSERPATYQVVDGLRPILEKYNIPVRRLCVDDSGTQSVADVIEVEIGHGVLRLNSGVAASDAAVSPQDVTPANTKYVDAGTESWIRLAGLGKQNRIRGMSDRCSNEFCIRRLVVAGRRKRLEKKSEFKTRLKGHRSPDDGDGSALCARAARPQMSTAGVEPGSNAPRKTTQKRPGVVIKTTIKPSNYVDT